MAGRGLCVEERELIDRRRRQHESLDDEDVDIDPEAASPRSGLELIAHEVHQAHRAGVVSAREARIILRDRVFGWATAEIATAEGRRWRPCSGPAAGPFAATQR